MPRSKRPPRLMSILKDTFQADGLCAQTDPEAFFPEKGEPVKPAKRICERCDVQEACLAWALDKDERYGVWGGLSENERKKIRAERNALKA